MLLTRTWPTRSKSQRPRRANEHQAGAQNRATVGSRALDAVEADNATGLLLAQEPGLFERRVANPPGVGVDPTLGSIASTVDGSIDLV